MIPEGPKSVAPVIGTGESARRARVTWQKELVAHLDKHKRFLRGELARRVNLKFMPELRFKIDTSFASSKRIDELLASPKVARDLDADQ